jgi:small conductance mechanosensitive channel
MVASVLMENLSTAERDLEEFETSIAELRESRKSTDLAARPGLDLRLARRHSELNFSYDRLDQSIALLKTLQDDEPDHLASRELEDRLWRQAEILAGRVELHAELVKDVQGRVEEAPDTSELKAVLDESEVAFSRDIELLGSLVELMDTLQLDTSEYKATLLQSGQISGKTVDRNVVWALFEKWAEALTTWLGENVPQFVFKVLAFLLIVAVFWGFAALSRKLVNLVVRKMDLSQLLERMLISTASKAVILLGILVAFTEVGVQLAPLLAGLGIAGFIVGFALQDSLSNFASGLMILSYRPFDVGDVIEAGGAFGKVSDMSLVSTKILTFDNQTMVVPNNKIWQDVIKNVTAQDIRRVDMVFGISYSDDIPHAEKILAEIVQASEKILDDPEPVIRLHNLGESSVDFIVRPWAKTSDYWDVFWDVTRQVKLRFDGEGISIPFPQRDVHFYQEGAQDRKG